MCRKRMPEHLRKRQTHQRWYISTNTKINIYIVSTLTQVYRGLIYAKKMFSYRLDVMLEEYVAQIGTTLVALHIKLSLRRKKEK